MRDRWIDDHVGAEASVRPDFEAELGQTLQSAWRQPVGSSAPRPSGPAPRVRAMIWAAAAAVVLVGGAVLLTNGGKPRVTSTTDDVSVSVMVSTTVVPTSVVVESTLGPETTIAETSSLPSTTVAPAAVATSDEERTVLGYLTALADERYDDAARVLGEGGLSLEERSDLRPFLNADGQIPDLADSLRQWCKRPALCRAPDSITSDGSEVTASFNIGAVRSTLFVASTFEGSAAVRGLPLQIPGGDSLAVIVQCPTASVSDTAYADLDGDGWFETVVLTDDRGGNSIMVCGSALQVPAYVWPLSEAIGPANRRLLPLDIEADGRDELMAGQFLLDPPQTGEFIALPILRLGPSGLESTGQSAGLNHSAGLYVDKPTSFGCVDLDGNGVRDLVSYTYSFIGGTDISNSTALEYEASGVANASSGGQLALPESADEAFRLISGYCGNVPTLTG